MMKKVKCFARIAGKETEQIALIKTVLKSGDKYLKVEIGDLAFWVKADHVEAVMSMNEVKRLLKKVDELTLEHQLDMAQIAYQRRQIDFLMEG